MINNVDLELIGVGYYDLIYMNVGGIFDFVLFDNDNDMIMIIIRVTTDIATRSHINIFTRIFVQGLPY